MLTAKLYKCPYFFKRLVLVTTSQKQKKLREQVGWQKLVAAK